MIVCRVHNTSISAAPLGPVTAGSVGLPVRWHFDEAWDGLAKIAIFRVGNTTGQEMAVLNDTCLVPHELLAQENAGENLFIGVYGRCPEVDAQGNYTVVMPTIWTYVRINDAPDPHDVDPEPTPGWEAQLQAAVDEAMRKMPFIAEYGVTTLAELDEAYAAKTPIWLVDGTDVYIMSEIYVFDDPAHFISGTGYKFVRYEGTEQQICKIDSAWSRETFDLMAPISEGVTAAVDAAEAAEVSETNAAASSAAAAESEENAEAWAVGERGGQPVAADDETYQNNAKWWAALAQQGAADAGFVWFDVDEQSGEVVVTVAPELANLIGFRINENTGDLEVLFYA